MDPIQELLKKRWVINRDTGGIFLRNNLMDQPNLETYHPTAEEIRIGRRIPKKVDIKPAEDEPEKGTEPENPQKTETEVDLQPEPEKGPEPENVKQKHRGRK